MRDYDLDRTLLGVLAAAIRAQRVKVRTLVSDYGRRDKRTRTAVARLDELREAHAAVGSRHGDERAVRDRLRYWLACRDEGADEDLAISLARQTLKRIGD